MTTQEAERLALALRAGYETVSRAEYYIRHGLSQPEVRNLVDALRVVASGGDRASVALEAGVEQIENPHRPRPTA